MSTTDELRTQMENYLAENEKFTDKGVAWQYGENINFTEDQDVHVLNKELMYV